MDEYIERDALLQDIEDSVRITSKTGTISPETRGAYKIIERIKSAAAADVVAVVRCKDCDHKHAFTCEGTILCTYHGKMIQMHRSDFCSYGKRKEGVD